MAAVHVFKLREVIETSFGAMGAAGREAATLRWLDWVGNLATQTVDQPVFRLEVGNRNGANQFFGIGMHRVGEQFLGGRPLHHHA